MPNEQKEGFWRLFKPRRINRNATYKCSECGKPCSSYYNDVGKWKYCPHCGAAMTIVSGSQCASIGVQHTVKGKTDMSNEAFAEGNFIPRFGATVNEKKIKRVCAIELFPEIMQAIEKGVADGNEMVVNATKPLDLREILQGTGEMYAGHIGKAICKVFQKYESEGADDETL